MMVLEMIAAQTVGKIEASLSGESGHRQWRFAARATRIAELASGPASVNGNGLRQATTIAVIVAPTRALPTPWGKSEVSLPGEYEGGEGDTVNQGDQTGSQPGQQIGKEGSGQPDKRFHE